MIAGVPPYTVRVTAICAHLPIQTPYLISNRLTPGIVPIMESVLSSEQEADVDCLFDHFICRVSGLPADTMEALRAPRTAALVAELLALEAHRDARKETLSAAFFDLIGTMDDGAARGRLLQLRRDLYNARPVAAGRVAAVAAVLPPALAEQLEAFRALQARYGGLRAEIEHVYGEERQAARQAFQQLVRDEGFQKGLLLSSRSLFRAQRRYLDKSEGRLGNKLAKTERGLLRYFARAAMKATPFGTFCAVLPGVLTSDSNGHTPWHFDGDPGDKQSFIRLNKSLYGVLLEHLKQRPAVRRRLHVERNPTIRKEAGRLLFLAARAGTEVFQRVPHNAVIRLIDALFSRQPSRPLGDLIAAMQAHPEIEASEEEATAYLDKLIEIGLLRFRTGIREQEADWDFPLHDLLDPIDDDHARRTATLLRQLRRKADAFNAASVDERAALLDDTRALIDEACEAMDIKTRLKFADLPFYEDATAASTFVVARSGMAHLAEKLGVFTRLIRTMAWPRAEQAAMRHFFDTHYDAGTASVPLLQFYEEYYREHFKGHLDKQKKHQAGVDRAAWEGYNFANPFGLDLVKAMHEAHMRLTDHVATRWKADPDADEIMLTAQDFETDLEAVPAASDPSCSVSYFAQLVPATGPGEASRLLVPNAVCYTGYGKYFSRFLYLLPEAVKAALYDANDALTPHYLAEICGDADFNANLHPPLLPWEISYPTGESGEAEEQLRSAALFVETDPDDPNALRLRHGPTGQRVLPVDLGFLNPRMRPPLFQMLSWFTPLAGFSLALPELPWTSEEAQQAQQAAQKPAENGRAEAADALGETPAAVHPFEGRILYRPRVTFEGALVLTRKSWWMPGTLFPATLQNEAPEDYFIRVNRWRREHGIPEEVFVRIRPLPMPMNRPAPQQAAPPEKAAANGQDAPAEQAAAVPEADAAQGRAEAPEAQQPPTPPPSPVPRPQAHKPQTAGSRDFFKPQYIDFNNPLLVGLFGKMTVNLNRFLVTLEERYPDADALPRYLGRAYASEMIVQLNFPDEKAFTPAIEPSQESQEQSYVETP